MRLVTRHLSLVTPAHRARAFTLLEVVVAVGIFAIGMVAVIGLFTPVAKSVSDLADAEAATRVTDLLNSQLQAQEAADVVAGTPFASLTARLFIGTAKSHQLTDNDAKNNYNIATDTQHVLFASRDGTKIGGYTDAVWKDSSKNNSDRDKFFEIALIRNEAISPIVDETVTPSPLIAYTARVRWPSFVPIAGAAPTVRPDSIQIGANPTATVPFDHSQKQVLFFSGVITR